MITRRTFLKSATVASVAMGLQTRISAGAESVSQTTYRAAIIGCTGQGDYGHGYDRIFNGFPNVTVEAVADPNAEGCRKAATTSNAKRQYADYREMLTKEKPDLVCVATRHPALHREMALAAIEVCSGLFMEKPITETLADADAIISAAEKRKTKIAMAHNRRYMPEFIQLKSLLDEQFAGAVRMVRIQGKQDLRAGGEDLLVLGVHDFDIMRFFFGDPLWCSATISVKGKDAETSDIKRGSEPVMVWGDTIHAQFGFPNNIGISWSSVRTDDDWNSRKMKVERGGFEIHGSKRIIAYQVGVGFVWLDSPFLPQKDESVKWQKFPAIPEGQVPDNRRQMMKDLIRAIESDTQPACSGYDGRWAVEMVSAVYLSHLTHARVTFPLTRRDHPLAVS
jgi:predicted dehydrogenase